jgi:RND family efflux transporter MFP subunit
MTRLSTFARPSLGALPFLALIVSMAGCGGDSGGGEAAGVIAAVPVTTAIAHTGEVESRLHSVGRFVSENAPRLAAEVAARVEDVLVEEGETVSAGQVLVRLDPTAFELSSQEARAAILALDVSIANGERRVARYRDLKSTNALSQERLDDAESALAADRAALAAAQARLAIAEDRLTKTSLASPIDGVVERRYVSVGDFVQAGTPVIWVTDIVALRVDMPFPETVAHRLRVGQPVILESPVAPGVRQTAQIDTIRPNVGELNRALVAMARIENTGTWRPGAHADASVVVDRRPGAVLVPFMAVVERPGQQVVYLADGDRALERVVQPGERQNGLIEIVEGLAGGETVVVDGAPYLSDGAAIEVRGAQP